MEGTMTARQRRMFSLVKRWQGSGMSGRQFCERHGVTLSTFWWWCSEYRRQQNPLEGEVPSFVPVRRVSSRAVEVVSAEYQYCFADGASVRIPSSLGVETVAAAVAALRRAG
jgi:hypothetical protein